MKRTTVLSLFAWLTLSHAIATCVGWWAHPLPPARIVPGNPLSVGVFDEQGELVYEHQLPDTRFDFCVARNRAFKDLGLPLVAKPMTGGAE